MVVGFNPPTHIIVLKSMALRRPDPVASGFGFFSSTLPDLCLPFPVDDFPPKAGYFAKSSPEMNWRMSSAFVYLPTNGAVHLLLQLSTKTEPASSPLTFY